MIAFSGVRSSCDMFARNSDLCLLAASSSRLFSSSSLECRRELERPRLDLLLEARVGLLELGRHAIELLGECPQLVVARDLDPLVERSGADARRRSLDRLDRTDEPAGEEDAGGGCQEQEGDEQQRGAPDRRSRGANASVERLLDEDVPAERVDRLEGAQHLGAVRVAPGRGRVGGCVRGRAERGLHLRERGEGRAPKDEVDVRVRDQLPAAVDCVRVSRRPDPRSLHDRADEGRSISATMTPRPPGSATATVTCG